MIKAIAVQGTSIAKCYNLKFSIKYMVKPGLKRMFENFTVCFIFTNIFALPFQWYPAVFCLL